jgi:hypothetical protein
MDVRRTLAVGAIAGAVGFGAAGCWGNDPPGPNNGGPDTTGPTTPSDEFSTPPMPTDSTAQRDQSSSGSSSSIAP